MATKFGQNKPKLHRLQFCARNRGLLRTNSKIFGVVESNMLSKISTEPTELPWQPNLGKNKPKLH